MLLDKSAVAALPVAVFVVLATIGDWPSRKGQLAAPICATKMTHFTFGADTTFTAISV